jgi:hypothetical protein
MELSRERELLYRLLTEVLCLQRWAGGSDAIGKARIFALLNGFESALHEDGDDSKRGISEVMQEAVEEQLEKVDNGGLSESLFADAIRDAGIDKESARLVMKLCMLESRFVDAIVRIAKSSFSGFSNLERWDFKSPELEWFGSLHYMELVELRDGERSKLHSIMAPCVPRIGETVIPESGQSMEVVAVDYQIQTRNDKCIMVPHVILEPIDDDEHESIDDE